MLRILCGIDDQQHSEFAAEVAIDLAKRLEARLWFFMANPRVLSARGPPVYVYFDKDISDYLREATRLAKIAGVFDVICETRKTSRIPETILEYANEIAADYIVIGSDRRPSSWGWFRPSISKTLMTQSDIPVLVVKQKQRR